MFMQYTVPDTSYLRGSAVFLRMFSLKSAKTSAAQLHPFCILPMRIPQVLRQVYARTYVRITQSLESNI